MAAAVTNLQCIATAGCCYTVHGGGAEVFAWSSGAASEQLLCLCITAPYSRSLQDLQAWSRENFGHVTKQLEQLRKELDDLEMDDPIGNRETMLSKKKELDEMLYREEMMWLQRSRIMWLKEGDRNTKYFHSKARWRAKKNRIRRLKRADDSWCDNQVEMQEMASEYFKELFTSDENVNPQEVVNLFQPVITEDINTELCRPYSDEEIGNALFQIGPLKAPGPDGFPARFFQRNWDVLRHDVIRAVQEFFETGIMPEGVNDTCIVLIPKVPHPETLKDFRPISLCNVIYKVVSKCIVNRLRPLLQSVISPNQSAFIPGRLITDNALIAFECLHAINSSADERSSFCAYKLDLSKAYDRVEWSFLNKVLLKLGFHRNWVDRVMTCVTSVRYTVRFNGVMSAPFTPTRGIRQGDPISPYLFLFVADGLSVLMKQKIREGAIQELRICRGAPGISHLLFADDTLMFFKANQQQALEVKEVLDTYARCTGQHINPAKCSMMFNGENSAGDHAQVKQILEVERTAFEPKYLGLPTPTGRMKGERFQNVKERLSKRLKDYTERNMSAAAKEVLIKSVAQALPTYIMSVFKLPLGLCDELTSVIREFWWGVENGKRKTAWVAWEKLTLKKCCGGMGFKDLRLFNQAMLARQAWRLIEFPDSLCAQLLKAKYYPRGCLVDTAFCSNASPTWQAIMHGLELVKQGVIWRIGNGEKVRIWRDPWIPRELSRRVTTRQGRCRLRWVSELLDIEGRDWDHSKLVSIFNPTDVEAIMRVKLPARRTEDFVAWHFEKSGMFTVRSAYNLALKLKLGDSVTASSAAPDGERKLWGKVWSGRVPPKVNVFTWKLCRDALPTRQCKFVRKLEMEDTCTLCGQGAETGFHATVICPQARNLRSAMREHWLLPDEEQFTYTGPDWLLLLLDGCSARQRDQTKLLLWRAWTVHNNITHESGPTSILNSVHYLLALQDSLDGKQEMEVQSAKGKGPCWPLDNPMHSKPESSVKAQWQPPEQGSTKINIDGSFVSQTNQAGVGMVARDHAGKVLFTAWKSLERCASAEEAEAAACLEGIRLAVQWCSGPVIIESDCIRLVEAVQKPSDRSELSFVMREIKEMCQLLERWKVVHVKREGNTVANELALLARRNSHSAFWWNQAPACVTDLLKNDCNLTI